MNSQVTVRRGLGCLTTLAAMILVVTLVAVASVNPVDVFTLGPLWAKITVGFLGSLLLLILLQVLNLAAVRRVVRATSGMPSDDLRCPGCGEPLLAFIGAYGPPVRCARCGHWRHGGPACSGKGKRVRMLLDCSMCPQPTMDNSDLTPDGSRF